MTFKNLKLKIPITKNQMIPAKPQPEDFCKLIGHNSTLVLGTPPKKKRTKNKKKTKTKKKQNKQNAFTHSLI